MPNLSQAVFLGLIACTDAVELFKAGKSVKKEAPKAEANADTFSYGQFGKSMPTFWHDFVGQDPFYSNTWRHAEYEGHVIQVVNSTAYEGDSPSEYTNPTQVQWEETAGPDGPGGVDLSAFVQLDARQNMIESFGMTAAPADDTNVQLEWDNKPWMSGYKWDQSSINKIYKEEDSHSYISPYEQRDHSWNDAQYNQSDELKFVDNTKTLNADYVEQLETTAEHHLREGRSGVAAEDEV
jgi:hypothetical protein